MPHQVISVPEAHALLRDANPTVLDMRDAASFKCGHIPGAHRLTEALLSHLMRNGARREPALLYCYHGNSSQEMSRFLVGMGFIQLYELRGGWQAWEQADTPADDIDRRLPGGMTPLMLAAATGDRVGVNDLIARGANLNLCNDDGNNALWLACFSADAAIVETLIGAGIDLNQVNATGATALHYCASASRPTLLRLLLDAGADPELATQDDFTALDLCADRESLRLLRLSPLQITNPKH